ncbi:hypothetical protein ACFWN2_43825 [Lentzea sp. NPDC058436]|uniref:hypothetical protein n=1 Tax=Lentzea sp. NPDC058436 TaxID=3346499 RepID=UPI003668D393
MESILKKIPRSSKSWMHNAPDWIKNAYRLRLEIEYRRSHGPEFQRLFDRIMRSMHGDDYVATVAMSNEGDLGCDGMLRSHRVCFAVYGPHPYFRINEARSKMRSDFARLTECWKVPDEIQQWTFVVNYPGVQPSLLKIANELQQLIPGIDIKVWSREDLTQQFLLWSNRNLVDNEFGKVDIGAKALAPISLVPEDTALPSAQAQVLHRRLWARITCNKAEFTKTENSWLQDLTSNPWENLLTHTQILVGAIASAILTDAFDASGLSIRALQREAGLSWKGVRKDILHAWSGAINLILKEDSPYEVPEWPEDEVELVAKVALTCMIQERLTLAIIRKQARILNMWETDVLDQVWSLAAHEIKIHPD